MRRRKSLPVHEKLAVLAFFSMFVLPLVAFGATILCGLNGTYAALTAFILGTLFVIFSCVACAVLAGLRGRVANRKALADPEFVAMSGPPSPALLARAFIFVLCGTLLGAFFLDQYTSTKAGETDRAMIAALLFIGTMWLLSAAGSALSRYLLHQQAWQEHLRLVRQGQANARKLRTHGR